MAVTDTAILRGLGSEVGARGRERLLLGPFRWNVEFEVSEALPGRRIVWRSVSGAPFDLEVALDLEAAGATAAGATATRATYGAALEADSESRLA